MTVRNRMTRIVTTHYRYKRPPRKRAKAAAIEAPAIVRVEKKGRRGNTETAAQVVEMKLTRSDRAGRENHSIVANDDRKSTIVIVRRPKAARTIPPGLLPDTEEEANRRADAAQALWREIVHQATGKEP